MKFMDDPESFNKYWARLQNEIAYSNIEQCESAFKDYDIVPQPDNWDNYLPSQESMDDGLFVARLVPWDIDRDDNQTYRIQTIVTEKGMEHCKKLFQ